MIRHQWMKKEWYMMSVGQVGVFLTLPLSYYYAYTNNIGTLLSIFMAAIFFMIIAKCGYKISEKEGRKENGFEA